MSNYSDFAAIIREWAARPDYSDALVDGFMRSAESNLNRILRVKEMMLISDGILVAGRVALPSDWRELDYVRFNDGAPLAFLDRTDFFKAEVNLSGRYTITGNYIQVGRKVDPVVGLPVEISYYASVPHLSASVATNWLYEHYHDIYLQACLVSAYSYGQEDERALSVSQRVSDMVSSANDEHQRGRISGSQLKVGRNRGTVG